MYIKITFLSILLIIIFIGGRLLHIKGKPYHKFIFAFHKLLALVLIAFLAFTVIDYLKDSNWGFLLKVSVITAVISGLGLLASGGLLSLNKNYFLNLLIHRITSILFLTGTVGVLVAIFFS
jgi:hypothetical protein